MILLDTHVLIWADSDDSQLGRKARALIDRFWPSGKVAVPAIAFWEAGVLQARRRLRLPASVAEWRQSILAAGAIELPLDGAIAVRAIELNGLPSDPADRFIVATALIHEAALVTADERLLDWPYLKEKHDARL